MLQVNERTGAARVIRRSEVAKTAACSEAGAFPSQPRTPRTQRLVEVMLTPAFQVPLPAPVTEEPARLSADEIRSLFKEHVPGVERMLFRDQCGNYALDFIVSAYFNGFRAFQHTDMHGQ